MFQIGKQNRAVVSHARRLLRPVAVSFQRRPNLGQRALAASALG
jgi:hypothetical protein